jgi:hypothetical protein
VGVRILSGLALPPKNLFVHVVYPQVLAVASCVKLAWTSSPSIAYICMRYRRTDRDKAFRNYHSIPYCQPGQHTRSPKTQGQWGRQGCPPNAKTFLRVLVSSVMCHSSSVGTDLNRKVRCRAKFSRVSKELWGCMWLID